MNMASALLPLQKPFLVCAHDCYQKRRNFSKFYHKYLSFNPTFYSFVVVYVIYLIQLVIYIYKKGLVNRCRKYETLTSAHGLVSCEFLLQLRCKIISNNGIDNDDVQLDTIFFFWMYHGVLYFLHIHANCYIGHKHSLFVAIHIHLHIAI